MKKELDLMAIFRQIGKTFTKFHTTIFIIVVVVGLGLAVLDIYQLTNRASSGVDGVSDSPSINFDTGTMERLKLLHTSDSIPEFDIPEGRINPFAE